MKPNEIIIKVCNDRIQFNPVLSISIDQTNIPRKFLSFREHGDICWQVEMVRYDSREMSLQVKVTDFKPVDISKFDVQQPKKKIERLLFEKIEWRKLEPFLTSYLKDKLVDFITGADEPLYQVDMMSVSESQWHCASVPYSYPQALSFVERSHEESDDTEPVQLERTPVIKNVSAEFRVPFSEVRFSNGCVQFSKWIRQIEKEIGFSINNQYILAEFDHIKQWLAKCLNAHELTVNAEITLTGSNVTGMNVSSPQIDRITPGLIDLVKRRRVEEIVRKPKGTRLKNKEKFLFTIDELFSREGEKAGTERNIFRQTEKEVMEVFLEKADIRNKKQIEYLAEQRQSVKRKMQFTLHPYFGFLFFIEGNESNHFVWELLDSHATYVWSIGRESLAADLQFERVERVISTIQEYGREQYKQSCRECPPGDGFTFQSIVHDDIGSGTVDSFLKWRKKIDNAAVT
jgi:hypothetical protein